MLQARETIKETPKPHQTKQWETKHRTHLRAFRTAGQARETIKEGPKQNKTSKGMEDQTLVENSPEGIPDCRSKEKLRPQHFAAPQSGSHLQQQVFCVCIYI